MKFNNKGLLLALALALSALFLMPTLGASAAIDGGYVGSNACGVCHTAIKADFDKSGHPYKVRFTDGLTPVASGGDNVTTITDPLSALLTPKMPLNSALYNPNNETDVKVGTNLAWSSVSYVIGGYGWKARWGVKDTGATPDSATGYIWSSAGGAAQYNMHTDTYSSYGSATKTYSCAICHNTNGTSSADAGCSTALNSGRTEPWASSGLAYTAPGGFRSEWTFSGVHCEACHGPGSNGTNSGHADGTGTQGVLTLAGGVEICAKCHIRSTNTSGFGGECGGDASASILTKGAIASGDWVSHHESYNEMVGLNGDGVHSSLTCTTCHDPHKRIHKVTDAIAAALGIADNNDSALARGAIKKDCGDCHGAQSDADASNAAAMVAAHRTNNVTCADCHMAEATKSATNSSTAGWGRKGDLKSHMVKISTTPGGITRTNGFATIATNYITPRYACGKCHDSNIKPTAVKTYASEALAAADAVGYHNVTGIDNGYVGSNACAGCHETKYDDFVQSGHPYKVRMTKGKTPFDDGTCVPGTVVGSTICDPLSALLPTPDVTALWATVNGETKADLGVPTSGRLPWANISYVIGGYMSKARWGVLDTNGVGTNNTGYVWSSSSTSMTDNGMGAQFNMEQDIATPLMQVWSAYGDGAKKYNCAACHNTNGVIEGNKECGTLGTNLGTRTEPWASTGMTSTNKGGFYNEWTFSGVQCEACHGAAKNHVSANATQNVLALTGTITGGVIDTAAVATGTGYSAALAGKYEICAKCHIRGTNVSGTSGNNNEWGCPTSPTVDGSLVKALTYGAPAGGNWISHHEQYNEMIGANDGAHKTLSCTACHDPHKRAHKVTGDIATALGITDNSQTGEARGAVSSCGSCHDSVQGTTPAITSNTFHTTGANCVDCHMGEATKSGPANGEVGAWGKRADVKTHIFAIDSSAAAGSITRTNPNSDGTTIAKNALPVDYSCGKCHDSSMSTYVGVALTRAQAQVGAAKMHSGGLVESDCTTCHASPVHTTHTVTTTTTCTTCHTSTHGTIPLSGTMAACAACHSATVPPTYAGNVPHNPATHAGHNSAPQTCTQCHTTPGVVPTTGPLCGSCHAAPTPPVANFFYSCDGSTSGLMNLNAAPTTCPTGSTCTYAWTGAASGSNVTTSYTDSVPGSTSSVTLTVTANGGPSDTFTGAVTKSLTSCTVTAAPSCGTGGITYSTTTAKTAILGVTGSSPIILINWGDTNLTPGATTTHTYAYDGKYAVRWTVETTSTAGVTKRLACGPVYATISPTTAEKRTLAVSALPTYTTVKILKDGVMKSQGGSGTGSTWTSAALPGVSGYRVALYKYGKTFTGCTGAGIGTYDPVTKTWALDLSAGNGTMSCTVSP